MAFLTSRELTSLRSEALKMLPDLCAIYYDERTSDGAGGFTITAGTVGTAIYCKLAPDTRAAPTESGGQITFDTGWKLHIAYDGTIIPGYYVVIGGDTYDVVSVEDDHSWRMLKTAYMKRRDGA